MAITATPRSVKDLKTVSGNVKSLAEAALADGGGLLRLAPCWVPRSFLQPGKRLKLASRRSLRLRPQSRRHRRALVRAPPRPPPTTTARPTKGSATSSTTASASRWPTPCRNSASKLIGDVDLEQVQEVAGLLQVLRQHGPDPAPHAPDARSRPRWSGRKASPRAITSRRSTTTSATTSPTRSWASSPAPPRRRSARCLEDWNKGDNGILDLSKAYRLKPGTGWLIHPCILHAPGSLCTYEPQWGSDVFGMYQSLVEGREVPWSLLVKDMPKEKHHDLDFIVEQLDWEANVDPHFKENHYLEPIAVAGHGEGGLRRQVDRLRQGPRRAAFHRQGTDRRSRHRR